MELAFDQEIKLVVIVFLNSITDYEGGQLTFSMIAPRVDEIKQNQGDLLIFPSYRPYCTDLLISGKMDWLVGRVYGKPFS